MQLFKLINTLLNHNHDAFSRNLHLLPYEVVPLSPSAGLLSWVSNTQTLVPPSVVSWAIDVDDDVGGGLRLGQVTSDYTS